MHANSATTCESALPFPLCIQVSSATATEYSGHGFRSESAITGRFSFTFHTPGTFHYIAEGLADIGKQR